MIPPACRDPLPPMEEKSGRFGRGISRLRNAPATWQIIRILLIVQTIPYAWNFFSKGKLDSAQRLLGLNRDRLLYGDYWQPLSYAFIHVNCAHLLINGAAILLLGSGLEHITGRKPVRILALLSVLLGGLFFLLLTSADSRDPQTLVGSSAICFGFLVMHTTLSPDSKFLPLFLSGKSLGIGIILANLTLALLNPELPTGPFARIGKHLSENGMENLFRVSHACHLGGSLAGFLCGRYLLRPRVTLESLRRAREKRERTVP